MTTFRRHPTATDLRLTLLTGSDLTSWTPAAESIGGATAMGKNGAVVVSDLEIPGQAPARLVTVELVTPPGSPARFARIEAVLTP